MPDAYAQFCNQSVGYGFSYTLSLGTDPGVARITAPADYGRINAVGPLTVYWEGRPFFKLVDARLDNASAPRSSSSGPVIDWTIQDRRWKWQFGETLDGDYNREEKNGKLTREKSPRDLAKLCFEALKEKDVDVSALPSKPRPPKEWNGASAKEELDKICADYGCAPAFSPFTNKAYIVKLGKGQSAPSLPHKTRSDAFVNKARPDAIRFIGGSLVFQSAFDLGEAVGLEVDGTYKPLDELSYKPSGGWNTIDPRIITGIETTYKDASTGKTLYHRDLAQQSVWRCFRIKGLSAGGFSPEFLKGSDKEPTSIKDLAFLANILDKDPLTGERLSAYARGEFFHEDRYGAGNTKPKTAWSGTLQVNSERRVVIFSKPAYKLNDAKQPVLADLELIAAYEVKHDGVPIRYEKVRKSTSKTYEAGEFREYHEEVVREIIEKDAASSGQKSDNVSKCDKQAEYYIDAIADQFDEQPTTAATYAGLEKFSLDGRLRSVSWSFSVASSPETSASWNSEISQYATPWEQRSEARVQRQIEAEARKQARAEARGQSFANVIQGR